MTGPVPAPTTTGAAAMFTLPRQSVKTNSRPPSLWWQGDREPMTRRSVMAEATTSKPTEPDPQPDRSHVVPVLNKIEQLRLDLTKVANWLFVSWPEGVELPIPMADVSRHFGDVDQLRAARWSLSHLGDVQVHRTDTYGEARVRVGAVRVAVQAYRDLWDQAFPEVQ